MGGGRAALFQVVVGVRYLTRHPFSTNSWGNDEVEVFGRLASEVFCECLLVEAPGGLLAVPRGATFEFPAVEVLAVLPVSSALPGSLARASTLPGATKGVLSYQELSLSHGDPVRFDGWVTPFRPKSAYRSGDPVETSLAGVGVTHVADLERGPAVVRDLSTEGEEFRRSGVMKLVSWFLPTRR